MMGGEKEEEKSSGSRAGAHGWAARGLSSRLRLHAARVAARGERHVPAAAESELGGRRRAREIEIDRPAARSNV
jgi:hypothetical protein